MNLSAAPQFPQWRESGTAESECIRKSCACGTIKLLWPAVALSNCKLSLLPFHPHAHTHTHTHTHTQTLTHSHTHIYTLKQTDNYISPFPFSQTHFTHNNTHAPLTHTHVNTQIISTQSNTNKNTHWILMGQLFPWFQREPHWVWTSLGWNHTGLEPHWVRTVRTTLG